MLKIFGLDPRVKIILVILFSVLIFIVDNLPVAACTAFFFLAVRLVVRLPFKSGRSALALSMLVLFMLILQILFNPGGKWAGFIFGLVIGCRLASLMLLMRIFTETSASSRIALGLTSLGLNYRAAFIITSAFNLIPVFEEEGRSIMDAQRLRGMETFNKKSFFVKIKSYPGLAVPLVLSAMRKARLAGIAMDTRAFGAYKNRTWLEKLSMKASDYLALALGLCLTAVALFFNFWL